MIEGIVYDLQNIAANDLASIFWMMGNKRDGIIKGCTMTYTSSAISLAAGYFSARGHLTKLSGVTSVSLPAVNSGTLYCNLVYEIDLSQTASALVFTQGSFKILTSNSAYPTPTQEDLDNGGDIYQMSFAKFVLGTGGITSFSPNTAAFNEWVTGVTVPVSSWSGTAPYSQSITMDVTTASAQPIWDIDDWENVAAGDRADYKDSFNCIDRVVTTATGITLYCYVDKPTKTVKIKLKGL